MFIHPSVSTGRVQGVHSLAQFVATLGQSHCSNVVQLAYFYYIRTQARQCTNSVQTVVKNEDDGGPEWTTKMWQLAEWYYIIQVVCEYIGDSVVACQLPNVRKRHQNSEGEHTTKF